MNKENNNSDQVKECTLYVDGMHCASCEVLIEKKLLKQKGIKSVDASLKGEEVTISYVGDNKPDLDSLNKEFRQLGYKFSNAKFKRNNRPLIQIKEGSFLLNTEKMKDMLKLLTVFILFLFSFYFFDKLQLGKYVSIDSTSTLPAFFALGIVAGLSSCAALIGGLLLSMTKNWNELYIDSNSVMEKASPHIMFHSGRIISFTILGGLLGLISKAVSLNNATFFSALTIIVSIIMFVLALQMLGVTWAQKFKITPPKSFTRFAANENNFQGRFMPFTLGGLTFLLPCGFTLIAQSAALASGSFIQGGLIMLIFALGTLPTLLAISYSGLAFNSKPHLTAKFNIVAGLIIIFFAIYNINGQLNVFGLPSLSDIKFDLPQQTSSQLADANEQGEQMVYITAKGFEYIPTSPTTLKAGVKTKFIVDNQGIQGCAAFMNANGLFNNYVELKKGINTIDIENPKKGTYKLTCSMGMVPPVTIQVI